MKDLKFTGFANSKYTGDSDGTSGNFVVNITFRTDLISSDANNNFVILEARLGNPTATKIAQHEEIFGAGFKKLPTNLQAFKTFAQDYNLDLTIADSDGSNSQTLVDSTDSDSFSAV